MKKTARQVVDEVVADVLLRAARDADDPIVREERRPPSEPRVGMRFDELVKMRGRDFMHAAGWCGHKVGEDERGMVVEYRYEDCTVVLRKTSDEIYRVAEVRDARGQEDVDAEAGGGPGDDGPGGDAGGEAGAGDTA